MIISLVCAVVQVAWADTWDGKTTKEPGWILTGYGYENVMLINDASELAYVCRHFTESRTVHFNDNSFESVGPIKTLKYSELNYLLLADLDMGAAWTALGNDNGSITAYTGMFYGNGHTIRINISGATENYQGLFARIGEGGKVQDLHVSGNIQCNRSRLVGGIAGENLGTIQNCWVSADVSSDWRESLSKYTAKVGGIAGENSGIIHYCCMSGSVTNEDADVGGLVGYHNTGYVCHCTFYGLRNSSHSQDNIYIGDQDGYTEDLHTSFTDNELSAHIVDKSEYGVYCDAVQHPFSVSVSSEGYGTVTASPTDTREGQTVTLTLSEYTTLNSVAVKDAGGNDVSVSGNATGGYTFTMPKRNVTVTAIFGAPNWVDADKRAVEFSKVEGNTVTIETAAELGLLSYLSNTADGKYGEGMTFLLNDDLDMSDYQWTPISRREANAFRGTFDGQGHAIKGIKVSVSSGFAGLFGCIGGNIVAPNFGNSGVVRNLKLANSSITQTTSTSTGSIAGKVENGHIKNCYVGSDVTVTATNSCGGIVGSLVGYVSKIEGCYSAATVSGNSSVGGIVGKKSCVRESWETGDIVRNVSQATILLTGETPNYYAYIIGNNEIAGYGIIENNYYIDRDHISDTDTRAYHVTLDDALKEYGYGIAYKDGGHEYGCSGLKFVSGDQFLMNGEWYVAKDKTFYFNPTNDLAGAVLGNVTAGGVTVEKNNAGYYHFTTAADVVVSGTKELMLANNGDNNSLLKTFKGHTMNVTLGDRTLKKDGSWNTIYLPFNLTAEQLAADDCPLKGATIKTLTGSSFADGTLTLHFTDNSQITDGVPYIVKWETTGDDIENPVFKNVSVKYSPGKAFSPYAVFRGSFAPVTLTANDKTVLFLSDGNKLYYPTADVTVGACHGYFELKGISAGDLNTGVRKFVMDFGEGEATGMDNIGWSQVGTDSQAWYTLGGRRLSGKPATSGVYINNGRQVVIK